MYNNQYNNGNSMQQQRNAVQGSGMGHRSIGASAISAVVACAVAEIVKFMIVGDMGLMGWFFTVLWTTAALAFGLRALNAGCGFGALAFVIIGALEIKFQWTTVPDALGGSGLGNVIFMEKAAQIIGLLVISFLISMFAGGGMRQGGMNQPYNSQQFNQGMNYHQPRQGMFGQNNGNMYNNRNNGNYRQNQGSNQNGRWNNGGPRY